MLLLAFICLMVNVQSQTDIFKYKINAYTGKMDLTGPYRSDSGTVVKAGNGIIKTENDTLKVDSAKFQTTYQGSLTKSYVVLHDDTTTVNNVDTLETGLYNYVIPAGLLKNNGDKIEAFYYGGYGAGGLFSANKSFKAYFNRTNIFDFGPITVSNNEEGWQISINFIRINSTSAKVITQISSENSVFSYRYDLHGISYTVNDTLKITATSSYGSNDIFSKFAVIKYLPPFNATTRINNVPLTDTSHVKVDSTVYFTTHMATLKADKSTTINSHPLSSNVTVTASDVGLGNVTNNIQVNKADSGVIYTTPTGTSQAITAISFMDTTGIYSVNQYFAVSPSIFNVSKGFEIVRLLRGDGTNVPVFDRFTNDDIVTFDKTANVVNPVHLYYDGVKYHYRIGTTWTDATTKARLLAPIISAASISSSQINVTWANITNNIGYTLYKSSDNGVTYSVVSLAKDTCIYRNTGLGSGTKMVYKVVALANYASYRNSCWSNIAFNTSNNNAAPTIVTDSTSTDGTKIGIRFNKAMSDPSSYYWQFQCSSRNVVSANLKAGNSKIIEIVLDRAYSYGDAITVSYNQYNITASDGGVLQSFSANSCTNNVAAPSYQSLSGNNTANYLRLTPNSSMNIGNGTSSDGAGCTVHIAIYVTTVNTNNIVVSRFGDFLGNACWALWIDSDSKPRFYLYSGGTTGNNINAKIGTALSLNTWYILDFIYDGSGLASGITSYLNNVSQTMTTSTNGTYTFQANNYFVNIGYGPATLNYGFVGQIQDFAFFNKALNGTEIGTLYNASSLVDVMGTTVGTTNCKAYLRLKGNGNDASGNQSACANKGTPVYSSNSK